MKLLRAYTATCQCGAGRMALVSDGRTKQINRRCLTCGTVFPLLRDKEQDRPLPEIPKEKRG